MLCSFGLEKNQAWTNHYFDTASFYCLYSYRKNCRSVRSRISELKLNIIMFEQLISVRKIYSQLRITQIQSYSRKNPNRRGVEDIYIFEYVPPWNFSCFLLYPWKFQTKQSSTPGLLDIPQNCVRSLGISKTKNKDSWKFHIIFSWSPLKIPLCF